MSLRKRFKIAKDQIAEPLEIAIAYERVVGRENDIRGIPKRRIHRKRFLRKDIQHRSAKAVKMLDKSRLVNDRPPGDIYQNRIGFQLGNALAVEESARLVRKWKSENDNVSHLDKIVQFCQIPNGLEVIVKAWEEIDTKYLAAKSIESFCAFGADGTASDHEDSLVRQFFDFAILLPAMPTLVFTEEFCLLVKL